VDLFGKKGGRVWNDIEKELFMTKMFNNTDCWVEWEVEEEEG